MSAHDIETESLPAHVSICQERYRHLENRLDRVDQRLDKIDSYLADIHEKVDKLAENHRHKWDNTQLTVISALIGVCVFLISLLF